MAQIVAKGETPMIFIPLLILGAAIGAAATWFYMQRQEQNASPDTDSVEQHSQSSQLTHDNDAHPVTGSNRTE